ncbi:hypothetical protein, partial [Brachyspira pilosicoli]
QALPSVALKDSLWSQKKWGVGAKATTKNIKILLFFFPQLAVRTSSKEPKSASVLDFWNI